MISQLVGQQTTIYYQMSTTNQSFIDMHLYLHNKGIDHNKFFLVLYDPDLAGIDPRDPNLNDVMKAKILRECLHNFWYFIREVVRIPDEGGAVNSGKRYALHRGNLALNFGFINNWNMFLELPRQHYKTISAICWYLWVFNFRTTNTEIMFMNKKHDDSKLNLRRLKDIRSSLPEYLRLDIKYEGDKVLRPTNNVETLTHLYNSNKITTKPGARSKSLAMSLGRGCTMPIQWYDEYAFIPHNRIIYMSATPAYKTASSNAKANGSPYGILITTTPGDCTTDEGIDAKDLKDGAIPFCEEYYNKTIESLTELKNSNTENSFFYIRYTYKQLGSGEEYFTEMVKDLRKDWGAIRREVMLEWTTMSDNSPFTKQDLDEVGRLVMQAPIMQWVVNNNYIINIYKQLTSMRYPPIIGVDVSGGYKKDSSTISIIDSKTTDLIADFNCNYISQDDLAKVIYEIVVKYMPNAIVNIERNGGFGSSVLSILKKSKIKRNLYYEIKEQVLEERFNGTKMYKRKEKVKSYGFDETSKSRDLLMGILRERMEHHKSKFISPILYDELKTLEVKKNGRIEHSDNAHDDQVFSYLLALYVWYEGTDLAERFGLQKGTIKTDESNDELEFGIDDGEVNIVSDIESINDDSEVQSQLDYINSHKTIAYNEWQDLEYMKDQKAMDNLLKTPIGRNAYITTFHADQEDINDIGFTSLPDSVFNDPYADGVTEQDIDNERINNILNMTR